MIRFRVFCFFQLFLFFLGVQGSNFFSLIINDLENYFLDKSLVGSPRFTKTIENELVMYLSLIVLLYANDTVILSEYVHDLQKIKEFWGCCNQRKLIVNMDETISLI